MTPQVEPVVRASDVSVTKKGLTPGWGRRGSRGGLIALVLLFAAAPLAVSSTGLFNIELVLLYVATASGLNLALGYAGEFLLCQATTLGVAAYTAGILAVNYAWSPWAALPVALVVAVIWQVVVSLPGLRIKGLYLGLITFFSVLVFSDIVDLLPTLTGGGDGLIGVSPLAPLGTVLGDVEPYEVAVAIGVISVALCVVLTRSGWGLRLRALRDAPVVLGPVGLRIGATKIAVYSLSAVPAGLAGWLLPYIDNSLTATIFGLSLTLVLFAGVQLIAPGTLAGPVLGVVVLEGYSQFVSPFSAYNILGLGLLLALVTIAFPGGIANARLLRAALRRQRLPGRASSMVPAPSLVAGDRTTYTAAAGGHANGASTASHWAPELASAADSGSSEMQLRVEHVGKAFGGNVAVADVSLTLPRGKLLAVMGENGSGKTTLLNMVTGLVRPTHGMVLIRGQRVDQRPTSAIAELGCSRTFQIPQLLPGATVSENVQVGLLRAHCASLASVVLAPRRARRIDQARVREAGEIGRMLGFTDDEMRRTVAELPLGLHRLVEIARAVATGASLICLDEPSVGLSIEELADLAATLRHLRDAGRAILLVGRIQPVVATTADDGDAVSMSATT